MTYSLHRQNGQWYVCDPDHPGMTPVTIDFVSGKSAYRRKYGHAGGEAIGKAVGIKKGHRPTVVDATAGWGRDAFVLATLGCRVHMIERSQVMATLLQDGVRRAEQDAAIGPLVKDRLSLVCGDSRQALRELPLEPEVIYLDPMYPPKGKSALVKKDMQILHDIVGLDDDADDLLTIALTIATKRVVVKRPAYADWLGAQPPHTSLKTKKHRFDIYLMHASGSGSD